MAAAASSLTSSPTSGSSTIPASETTSIPPNPLSAPSSPTTPTTATSSTTSPLPTPAAIPPTNRAAPALTSDRKSTRLNSSHLVISYAVFCLKKNDQPAPHDDGD